MNYELFDKLMKPKPFQFRPEWRTFLEICEAYLKRHEIKNPIVVELGIWRDRQRKFYEKFFGAHYIGIDFSNIQGTPDILGNTHDPKTLDALKKRLKGRPINILFIDGGHSYEDVKEDFETYSPLCTDIIALHDIESYRYLKGKRTKVWKFWDKLKIKVRKGMKGYRHLLLISIHQYRGGNMGIGVIIKK